MKNNIIDDLVDFYFENSINCKANNKIDNTTIELTLPPYNESEFFARIVWNKLYPDEPVVDQYFLDFFTKIFYNVADPGKLHKALRDWIADVLLSSKKSNNITDAENKADNLLSTYESYEDILTELGKPAKKQQEIPKNE